MKKEKKITLTQLAKSEAINEVFSDPAEVSYEDMLALLDREEDLPDEVSLAEIHENGNNSALGIKEALQALFTHNLRMYKAIANGEYINK